MEKLLAKFRALPPHTLVVKLDGSDVVLARDSGGRAFRTRWEALGRGVLFSAEAALFYHIGRVIDTHTRAAPTLLRCGFVFKNIYIYNPEAACAGLPLFTFLPLTCV